MNSSQSVDEIQAVTGPFSYTGRYIAARLKERSIPVRGFVRTQQGDSGGIDCRRLQFMDPDQLAADLDGVGVLYNTYWIRFPHRGMTFERAVENTRMLAEAAQRAGVRRIVHISVSNPSPDSPFAYFRGKAAAEEAIRSAGTTKAILRPTLVFGREDILLNNIVWLLRRFHVFPLPGTGKYRVHPVFVGDVADLAVREAGSSQDRTIDAAGPETLTFRQLVGLLAQASGVRAFMVPSPPSLPIWAGQALSPLIRDDLITAEEIRALMAETLISHDPPTASTRLTEWLSGNGSLLGRRYASELKRHWTANPGAPSPGAS